jgi:tRNA nucleotidyltransferase/poly(A) polymerase
VGGPVRDLIISNCKILVAGQDLDIAVEKEYQAVGEDLAQKLKAKIIRYQQFMTMTLQLKDLTHIDIAQTREEVYSKPAVLPRVFPATITEDLKRRDFTINAMAMEIKSKPPYAVIDPFEGRKDLSNKIIRVLHECSFIDDPTRIFRAIRFAIRFRFKIEPETELLMKTAIKQGYLNLLSGERILYELKLIMNEKQSVAILYQLQNYRIISKLFNIKLPKRFFLEQELIHQSYLKLIHFFSYLPESIWSKYPLTKETAATILALNKFPTMRTKLVKAPKPSEIYKTLKPIPASALEIVSILEKSAIKEKIDVYLVKYSKVKTFVSGKTLKQLQIPSGKIYSQILTGLLYQKLDGKIKTKKQELNYIENFKEK